MKFRKQEYAYIATKFSGKKIASGLSAKELADMVARMNISMVDQNDAVDKFAAEIGRQSEPEKIQSNTSYIQQLAATFGVNFPIPLSYLIDSPKRVVAAWYTINGFNLSRVGAIPTLTDEQSRIVNTDHSILVVNAGPGTGKTTTANLRAKRIADSGEYCILVSYTNEAIYENYKRLVALGCNVGIKSSGEGHNIWVTTVDSLAAKIVKFESNSFDATIKRATKLVDSFSGKYTHLIVDEAQDIDELRAELILALGRSRSMTVFGDPRQRLSDNCGKWYQEMWVNNPNNRIALTITHRFSNPILLDVVNGLSKQRPQMHAELSNIDESNVNSLTNNQNKLKWYSNPADVIDLIKANENCSFAVISPTMNRENAISRMVRNFRTYLCDIKIACYSIGEANAYCPKGVLFTTIHGAKGKEFDYVVLIGMSGFPGTFPLSLNEADSWIYVAYSRAKKQIFHCGFDTLPSLPRGFNDLQQYIDVDHARKYVEPRHYEPWSEMLYGRDICNDRSLHEFSEVNQWANPPLRVCKQASRAIHGPIKSVIFMAQISMCGYPDYLLDFINQDFVMLEPAEYKRLKFEGKIHGMRYDGKLVLTNPLQCKPYEYLIAKNALDKNPSELSVEELQVLTLINDIVVNGSALERYTPEPLVPSDILYLYKVFVEFAAEQSSKPKTEKRITWGKFTMTTHVEFADFTIEFVTHQKNVLTADLISAITGKPCYMWVIGEANLYGTDEPIDKLRYYFDAFYRLRTHVNWTQFRANKSGSRTIREGMFVVDTEFMSVRENIHHFEIALINMVHPYKSLISLIKSTPEVHKFGAKWLSDVSMHVDTFDSMPTIEEFVSSRYQPLSELYSQTVIGYYHSGNDISWIPDPFTPVNLAQSITNIALKKGYLLNQASTIQLGAIYNTVSIGIESMSHMSLHNALTDALILYELFLCWQ